MPVHESLYTVPPDLWVPRRPVERVLNAWASSHQSPRLRLIGPDGIGKSALLVHWLQRHRHRHPRDFTFYYAADATLEARRPTALLRCLLQALAAHYGFREPVPHDPDALAELLPHWLARAAALGRNILLLDGVDRLEDTDVTGEFQWLPAHLPPGVRLALAYAETHIGTPPWLEQDRRLDLPPFDAAEAAAFLEAWAGDLPSETRDALRNRADGALPLWLRLAAEYARTTGASPDGESPAEAASQLLGHLESGEDGDAIIQLERALWAAGSGLTPDQTAAVTGSAEEAMHALAGLVRTLDHPGSASPRHHWIHPLIRETAGARHLREGVQRQEAHLALARIFLPAGNPEATREAVEQLERSGRREGLAGALLHPEHAPALLGAGHRHAFRRAWSAVQGDASPIPRFREALDEHDASEKEARGLLLDFVEASRAAGWSGGAEEAVRWVLAAPGTLDVRDQARSHYLLGSLLADQPGNDTPDAPAAPGTARAQEAEEHLAEALRLRTEILGAGAAETASARHALASLLEERGDLERAEALYREALGHREQAYGDRDPAILPELTNLASVVKARNDHSEARRLYRRAVDIAHRHLGSHHPSTASVLDHLAGVHYAEHDFETARDLYQQALGITEQGFGSRHPATAACLHNLATALDACEDYRTAEELYRQTLHLRRELNGDRHVDTASSVHNLAAVLDMTAQREEAERLYREAIDTWEALVGRDHPATATSINNLADLLRDVGRLGEAEQLYRQNLETWRRLVGDEHPHTLMTLTELGGLLTDSGRYHEAEPMLRDAIDRTARILGRSHSHHITAVCKMAVVHRDRGDRDGAKRLLEQTLAHVEGTLGLFSPHVQRLRRLLDPLQGPETLH